MEPLGWLAVTESKLNDVSYYCLLVRKHVDFRTFGACKYLCAPQYAWHKGCWSLIFYQYATAWFSFPHSPPV